MKLTLSLLCLFVGVGLCFAQTSVIKGTVVSQDDGQPVIGATVLVKGTRTGTVTDYDGAFTLDAPKNAKTLVISYVGMEKQEIAIAPVMKITLSTSSKQLDEVMVVAYGTAKRSAFTGSAAVIKQDKIATRQVSNISNALTGQVAGVQTTSESGRPGAGSTIRIRGIGSLYASNNPLYILDGTPYDGDLSTINTQDIESMTVLKDAAANALYGARGANGVILITTKKGKTGEAKINADVKWGVNQIMTPRYNTIRDPKQYYELAYASLYNSLFLTDPYTAYENANQMIFTNQDGGLGYQVYTIPQGTNFFDVFGKVNPSAKQGYKYNGNLYTPDDWYDEMFKNNLRQEYNFNISGASDKLTYYLSFGHLYDKGITENSGYKRTSIRFNGDYQAKKWLKIGANMAYTKYLLDNPRGQSGYASTNLFYIANSMAPIYPMYVRNEDGSIKKDSHGLTLYDYGDGKTADFQRPFMAKSNPLAMVNLDENSSDADEFSGRWFAHVDVWNGIKLQANIGYDVSDSRTRMIYNPYYGQYAEDEGQANVTHSRISRANQQYLLTYNKVFNDVHSVDFLGGYEYYEYKKEFLRGQKSKLYNPDIKEVGNAILNPVADSYVNNYSTQGILFRGQYEYDSKYILSASFRRDASSRFYKDNRWGNFWSVGGGWLINKESFMDNVDWVDMLKFKVSYGEQGNDNLNRSGDANYYPYMDIYTLDNNNGNFATTLTYKGNRDITWETSHSFNTGFDFALFKGRLNGSAEFFTRQTSDMLYMKPINPSQGYSSYPVNVGSMRNCGVEFDLNGQILKTKTLEWNAYLNGTHFKNKILELHPSLDGEMISGDRIYTEDESMYRLYIRNYAGVDKETGKALYYKDKVNDKGKVTGRETTDDWSTATRYASNDILPKIYGGLGTNLAAFGFDLSVALSYQLGGKILDYSYMGLMHSGNKIGQNWDKDILNTWTPDNRNTNVPRLNKDDLYANSVSDRFLINSNYLTLQNITFGYTVPKSITRKFEVASLRLYFVADNVAMLTARKGLDPRQGYVSSENTAYSAVRTISGGLQLSF